MTGQVTVPLPARRLGHRGRAVGANVAPGAAGTATAPTPDRIPRAARVLALAHHWQALLRTGAVRNQADLARLVGVSRARVTQVMGLLNLAPQVQEGVLLSCGSKREAAVVGHAALSRIASEPLWDVQRSTWATLRDISYSSRR